MGCYNTGVPAPPLGQELWGPEVGQQGLSFTTQHFHKSMEGGECGSELCNGKNDLNRNRMKASAKDLVHQKHAEINPRKQTWRKHADLAVRLK